MVYSKLSHAIKDMLGDAKHTGEETLSIIKKKQMGMFILKLTIGWYTDAGTHYRRRNCGSSKVAYL